MGEGRPRGNRSWGGSWAGRHPCRVAPALAHDSPGEGLVWHSPSHAEVPDPGPSDATQPFPWALRCHPGLPRRLPGRVRLQATGGGAGMDRLTSLVVARQSRQAQAWEGTWDQNWEPLKGCLAVGSASARPREMTGGLRSKAAGEPGAERAGVGLGERE